ncbi:MAG: histidine kinase [Cytophagales bacterium CG12_big_fil_rev_8_21_14_0_65_40_12]|nr:MAG: histidine kinase [Cytophagales bacterium CG12_big_fil_rev_8_21_14_0_65_40_12]PIW02741.1 MAG: histidine kinase [Cytophagales bacterium CG17_big_fil_post_rev_8_21_14_2_50_40_13]
MQNEELLNQIASFPSFQDVPRQQIQWLLDRGEVVIVPAGDTYIKKGDPIDKLIILLKGSLSLKMEQNGQFKEIYHMEVGEISGLLPYSRAQSAMGYGTAVIDSEFFMLNKSHFRDLVCECHELTAMLVHEMTDRVRDFTRSQHQDEKLMALGKLSAGLAHELNNPAAAMVRSSESLQKHLGTVPDKFKRVMSMNVTNEQIDLVSNILFEKVAKGVKKGETMMVRSQREDELTDWLEDHGYGDCYMLSETLAEFGFEEQELQEIRASLDQDTFPKVMEWIDNVLTTEKMVGEIKEAARRISSLVNSIKSYSHMDRSSDKAPTDIREGIQNTITILGHKLRKNQVKLIEEYDDHLPLINAIPGELNQVWTNIIDNALDAMESEGGSLTIKADRRGDVVNVQITDTGTGIPKEIQNRIFEPFFTTKDIGKGTGLGLEVVHRIVQGHNGSIGLESVPGKTKFEFCFPVSQ